MSHDSYFQRQGTLIGAARSVSSPYLNPSAVAVPHRRAPLALATLLATACAFLLTAAPAFAVKVHLFTGSFGTAGSAAGQLSLVAPNDESFETGLLAGSGLAVNAETHDVYVADTANHRVAQFSSSGTFIRAWGWGVATGAAEFQTCTASCQIGISGPGAGQFESPLSVAVDNSCSEQEPPLSGVACETFDPSNGDVYVADTNSRAGPGTDLVQKFDPSGSLITTWATGGQLDGSAAPGGPFSGEIVGIDTDPSGNLFVYVLNGNVFKFAPDGTAGPSAPSPFAFPSGFSVDSSGNLYTGSSAGQIEKLDPSGNSLGFIDPYAGGADTGLAVDPSTGDIYIGKSALVNHYAIDPSGSVIEPDGSLCPLPPGLTEGCQPTDTFGSGELSAAAGLAVDSATHDLYVADTGHQRVTVFTAGILADLTTGPATNIHKTSATLNAHLDPAGGTPVLDCHFEYVTKATYEESGFSDLSSGGARACDQPTPISTAIDVSTTLTGLAAGTAYRFRVVAANEFGTNVSSAQPFDALDAVTALTTEPATPVGNESATLNGSFLAEEGLETKYWFEYGTSTNYGHNTAEIKVPGSASPTETKNLSAAVESLVPNTTYHYRIVAENSFGTTAGADQTFTTFQSPTIEAFSSSDLTATSAVLHATINPQGFDTTCEFEYGTSTGYGQSAPCPAEITAALSVGHSVEVSLVDLQEGITYHFRVTAHNQWGTVTSEDQSFEFFPPPCPNSAVRQQTGSAYLPDCRAYELVSPPNANGTLLYSGGPTSPYATSPSRFAYTGAFGALPEAGETIGGDGDLYVATRTTAGWVSHYIGPPGTQTGCVGGPPNNPESHTTHAEKIQKAVLTDSAMSRFLDFNLGTGASCYLSGNGTTDATQQLDQASNAPYLWSSEGTLLAHLPTNLESTPGAAAALTCPVVEPNVSGVIQQCDGDVAASGDLTHLLLSSRTLSFSEPGEPAGLTETPGSAYDDNLATGKVTLISTLKGGGAIRQDPTYATHTAFCSDTGQSGFGPCPDHEFIRFPAVSTDGSHILMSTATAGTPWCNRGNSKVVCPRFTETPIHLYMSIDDRPAVAVSRSELTEEDVAVNYVGMTEDGSRVFFTSEEHLTAEDPDHGGASLYMWSQKGEEEGKPLTLISKAAPGSTATAGDTEDCSPATFQGVPWTKKCGVLPYSGWSYANAYGSLGGNGHSDTAIAQNGDIYFFSPEQLDGDRGVLNQQNLYDYRAGRVHYVTTFAPTKNCYSNIPGLHELYCAEGPIVRFQVTPDDTHAAFVTAERLTSYDNAGHLEMYSYTPATGALVCDSCNPTGRPATDDVHASQNGLFLTEDGRAFFSTAESLLPRDTDKGIDVYEFVDGRPQLITPGTGTATVTGTSYIALEEQPGLIGVSANGTDVYFSTYDSLVSADQNGNFLKFYDARTNGGLPQPPPAQPCAAAEECHGPGTEAPTLPTQGTAATLAGGNATHSHKHHGKKHHKKAKNKRHHKRAGHNHGGKK